MKRIEFHVRGGALHYIYVPNIKLSETVYEIKFDVMSRSQGYTFDSFVMVRKDIDFVLCLLHIRGIDCSNLTIIHNLAIHK